MKNVQYDKFDRSLDQLSIPESGMYEIASAKGRGQLLYFAQSDSHLRTFMPRRSSFASDLATRLMLEPGVVILDSLFLTSEEIASDLAKSNRSLIWNGLKTGLIVPAFREKGAGSFVDNLRQGILPTTSIGVREDALEIAIRLDAAIKGKRTPKITWPGGIGISFGKLIDEQFRRESIVSDRWGDKEIKLWNQSHDLRNRYLDMAWQREPNPEETGLRRSTIFTVIASDLGFTGNPLDTAKIIDSVAKRRRAALRATLLWVDELYNYNQASRFGIKPSFPIATGSGALMLPDLLWPRPKQGSDTSGAKIYSHTIRWPSRKMLSSVSPDTLLGLRTDEHGGTYIHSLTEFRRAPSQLNWEALKVAADGYAERVCNAVASEVTSGMQTNHLVAPLGVTIGLALATAASGGLFLAGVGVAGIVTLITAGVGSVYAPVNEVLKKDRSKDGELAFTAETSGKLGQIRMDLPTK